MMLAARRRGTGLAITINQKDKDVPRIFDNIKDDLLTALRNTLGSGERADFCVGYFNLRGWRLLREDIDQLAGGGCRVLIGMSPKPGDELREHLSLRPRRALDQQQIFRRKREIVEGFRHQLTLGAPNPEDEDGLRDLVRQLRSSQVTVKLFLRDSLHAKLYLVHRSDYNTPTLAFLGSSNLTLAGLRNQGELNIEVSDYDACHRLSEWFEERWEDEWCLDISEDLIEVINSSWAREEMLRPYDIYLKIAYHLSREARAGLDQFQLPSDFADQLLDFQAAAVRIAARHLNSRGGVLLGDVVGLGKTLMATALARIFQDDHGWRTLIICPPNLQTMWQRYVDDYRLFAKVVSLGKVISDLPDLRRYQMVIIDESHNLRNRRNQTYAAVHDFIRQNECCCILLSATPYNKSFLDLSAQLRLFIDETNTLGCRPEQYLKTIGEAQFQQRFQSHTRSIVAFEKSESPTDWRRLMGRYLVRRTRSYIIEHYAEIDAESGRHFLQLPDGGRYYFPLRRPKTVRLQPNQQVQRLYSERVVDLINDLSLPRYGLSLYVDEQAARSASKAEAEQIENLSRAGKRLMGFCRTNLFKRLESSGKSFLQSVDRHIARNHVFLHAIDQGLELPIGSLEAHLLDPDTEDEDSDRDADPRESLADGGGYQQRARQAYADFSGPHRRRFKWLRAGLFSEDLRRDLQADIDLLTQALTYCGEWKAEEDKKLLALHDLISRQHPRQKALVFSQFADTVRYLQTELSRLGVTALEAATGTHGDPTKLAQRFSPRSNGLPSQPEDEIRVLLSTDVLSEGQNLQDCAIVINYDLPWAIIRLSQRAGRVDRIGQRAPEIHCYSFLPAQGVEAIIRLRSRVRQRLLENGEVVGTDERFFEDEQRAQELRDLYTEKAEILNQEGDSDVDLSSKAYQIWHDATKDDPELKEHIESLPDLAYSSRHYLGSPGRPQGVITYVKASDDTDAIVWVDQDGQLASDAEDLILDVAKCQPDTPASQRHPSHHELVERGVAITQEADYIAESGGQLGRTSSTRHRAYTALKRHIEHLRKRAPLFARVELDQALNDIYRYPLLESARGKLHRQLGAAIQDEDLAQMILALWRDDRLCRKSEDAEQREPRILCSLGLFDAGEE